MSKGTSGYEIRFNVLHLAKEIVENASHMELAKAGDGDKSEIPTVSTELVLAEAEKLYKFVEDKDKVG